MTKHPRDVNPDLVRQEIEKGRMGDRELAKKPGETPATGDSDVNHGPEWDEDQRALIENQDQDEIDKSGFKESR